MGESITPQLDTICNESVRFTHAYTTSVLAIPALSSILTGLYPAEHGVHRNDGSFYGPGVKSLPELAREAGYETFLASGGVRADGGFYRPADETVKKFLSLLENRGEGVPFVGVVDLADLSFPEVTSLKTAQSDKREGMYNGKLQEIDEAIGGLRRAFIKMKIWDQLTVVIVGLEGTNKGEHEGLSDGISLYDEIVRVPLLIKPMRKPRDQGPSWKIDGPVSLADLGTTLFDLAGVKVSKKSSVPVLDFREALEGKDLHSDDRPLFCESDLPPWRDWGPRLISMRKGEWVYWPEPEEKLFDTYSDRLELRNLFSLDFTTFSRLDHLWKGFSKIFLGGNTGGSGSSSSPRFIPISVGEKLKTAQIIFSRASDSQEKLRALNELEIRRPDDWQSVQWHVRELLENRDLKGMKELLAKTNPVTKVESDEYNLWQTFVRIKFKGKSSEGETCLQLAVNMKHNSLPSVDYFQTRLACKDREVQAWSTAFIQFKSRHLREASAFFDLARALSEKREEQTQFAKYFWLDGATWDFQKELPAGPSLFELFADLVPNADFQSFVRKKQFP